MQSGDVIKLYDIGLRGKPIRTIGAGDLAQPYARSLWTRIREFGAAIVDVAREARALEQKMLGSGRYRGFGES
jgi:hypothetical protein